MKTRTKALLLALCAVLLVVATVFTTLAFLQDITGTVTNTFVIGKVDIGLWETNPETETMVEATKEGNLTHAYNNITPGSQVDKDPEVRVVDGSQDSWVFVKVENKTGGLVDYTIDTTYWTAVPDTTDVYYHEYNATDGNAVYGIFTNDKVSISDTATNESDFGDGIVISAYAIQKSDADFADAKAAWAEF